MLRAKRFLVSLVAVMLFVMPFSQSFASSEKSGVSPDAAMKMLVDGNARFVEGKAETKSLGVERRKELSKGQHPFAIVLSCSDSRVPPEHIFNQGLGDIFVVRVAGNIADSIELGSVEYAAEHLNVPLVLVLGHRSCGAVTASIASSSAEGNIDAIVKKIAPAVETARKTTKDKDSLLNAAINENAKLTAKTLTEKSAILKHLVDTGKLKVVAGVYDLASGKVEILDSGTAKTDKKVEHSHAH